MIMYFGETKNIRKRIEIEQDLEGKRASVHFPVMQIAKNYSLHSPK